MDTPINPDIETDPKELRKKIRFEAWKMRRQNRTLEKLKIQQKKIGLKRLEATINTFTDRACFLELSDDGKYVSIQLDGIGSQNVYVNGYKGLCMLHAILAHQNFLNGGVEMYYRENNNQSGATIDKAE